MIREILTAIGKGFVRGMSRVKTPVAKKEMLPILKGEFADGSVFKGTMDTILHTGGIYKKSPYGFKITVKEADWGAYTNTLRHGDQHIKPQFKEQVATWRNSAEAMWQAVKKYGGTVKTNRLEIEKSGKIVRKVEHHDIGKVKPYFPNYLLRDVAEKWKQDADTIFRETAERTNNWNLFTDQVGKVDIGDSQVMNELIIRRMASPGGFDKKTQSALSKLIKHIETDVPKGGQLQLPGEEFIKPLAPVEAMILLRNRAYSQIASPYAVLRHSRKLSKVIGDEFYESRPDIIIDTYVRGWSKHVAALKAWGPQGERKIEMLNKVRGQGAQGVEDAEVLEKLANIVDGSAEWKYATRGQRLFTKAVTEFEVGTKIGLGTAFIPNVFQLLISTMPKLGIMRTASAIAESFTKQGKRAVSMTGINGTRILAFEAMAGMSDDMIRGSKFTNMMITWNPGMRAFQWINKYNNTVSALAGRSYIKNLAKRGLKGERRALAELEKLGLRAETVHMGDNMTRGMWAFANKMQLQRNPFEDPLWMNMPQWRMLALFKRFGYRQTALVYDEIIKSAFKYGDFKPLLRLGAGGIAGGWAVQWSKDMLSRGIGGDPDYWDKGDQNMYKQLSFWYAQSGAFGMLGDLVGRLKGYSAPEIAEGFADNLIFSLMPVVISEFTGIPGNKSYKGHPEILKNLAVDWAEEGIVDFDGFKAALEKNLPDFMRKVSPLGAIGSAAMIQSLNREKERNKAIARFFKGRFE